MQDDLNKFLDSLKDLDDDTGMVEILIAETLAYRDLLKEDTDEILSVGDTRAALDALEEFLRDGGQTVDLTNSQQVLFERWKKALNRM
jgi:hypothetical protein